jgi:hypothetical protein
MHTIQILGVGDESEFLNSLSHGALPDGVRISRSPQRDGVNMDQATLGLIIQSTSAVLVAAITAIGSVWAAKVAAAGRKEDQPKPPESPKNVAAVEIDTVSDTHLVVVDERFEQRLHEVLPANVKSVLSIRLRTSVLTHKD